MGDFSGRYASVIRSVRMSNALRKDLQRRSKGELIEMILRDRMGSETAGGDKQANIDWERYSQHHLAFKFYYLGWDMHGLAQQPDRLNTIEEHFFRALRRAHLVPDNTEEDGPFGLPASVNFQRCGRTDIGVSAFSQVVSLRVRSLRPRPAEGAEKGPLALSAYIHKLNAMLPTEIRIYAAAEVDEEFSARFSCTERQYKYFFIQDTLNIAHMQDAAQRLVGHHDFRNFCKIDASNVLSFVREIRAADIQIIQPAEPSERQLCAFVLKGSGFLWHQVRCLVAILFLIGRGDESPDVVSRMLDVEKQPCKPSYHMAPEIPLVLWDCSFADMQWNYEASVVRKVTEILQGQWEDLTIKGAIMNHMLETLRSLAPPPPANPRKRKYVQLLDRPTAPSLDELVDNLSGKRKKAYEAKRRRVNEYEEGMASGEKMDTEEVQSSDPPSSL